MVADNASLFGVRYFEAVTFIDLLEASKLLDIMNIYGIFTEY